MSNDFMLVLSHSLFAYSCFACELSHLPHCHVTNCPIAYSQILLNSHLSRDNVVCATSKASDQPAHTLEYSMSDKLLTEHHLEFLCLKGGCTGSSESTLVKMPHCWKSHVTAHLTFLSTHRHAARAQTSLGIWTVLLETSPLAKTKYGHKWKFQP